MNISQRIKNLFLPFERQSDGYHTFGELYEHRTALFVELMVANKDKAWWSDRHSDGSEAYGYPWVICGIGSEMGKQVTYHINRQSYAFFNRVEHEITKLPHAPLFDHHTPADVLFRLKTGDYKKLTTPLK